MHRYESTVEALKEHARSNPDRMAVWAEDSQLSYAQLYDLVCGFARYLLGIGIHRGDRVVMQALQSLGYVVAYYGTQLAGGVFAPVEMRISTENMESFVEYTKAFLLISEDASSSTKWHSRHKIIETAERNMNSTDPLIFPGSDEHAEILSTSGTTGKPKGVLLSHKNTVAVAENIISSMEYNDETFIIIPSPLNHATGTRRLTATVHNGSSAVILEGVLDIRNFFRIIDDMPVTGLILPPATLSILLGLSKDRLSSFAEKIEFIESTAAHLSEETKVQLCELLPKSRLYNNYGLSEAGASCAYDYNALKGLENCIGAEAINSHVFFVDDKFVEIESSKEIYGCLAISGDTVMMGYWDEPELTAQTLVDGVLVTSDVGYIEDGLIFIVGRADDLIQVGGYMVSPIEIEEAAMRCHEIEDCVCVALDDPVMGQVPRLYVVLKESMELDVARIITKLSEHLEPFKLPKQIETIDSIPRTELGKKIRRDLG